MYHTGPTLEVDEAVDRVKSGQSLDGRAIDAQRVFDRLCGVRGKIVFNRGFLSAFDVPEALVGSLVFRDCVLNGPAKFIGCPGLSGLRVESSQVVDRLEVKQCGSDSTLRLGILGTKCDSEVFVESNNLARPPELFQSSFTRQFSLENNRLESRESLWIIEQCHFAERLRIEQQRAHISLKFSQCHCDVRLHAQLSGEFEVLSFDECAIEGRLRIFSDLPCNVVVARSFVLGELDLSGVHQLKSLDLAGTNISGGRVVVAAQQLCPHRNWWTPEVITRESVFISERTYHEKTTSGVATANECADLAMRVAREFEELRNAFAATPVTDREEDVCHYKSMEYDWCRRVHEQCGETIDPRWRLAVVPPTGTCVSRHMFSVIWKVALFAVFCSAAVTPPAVAVVIMALYVCVWGWALVATYGGVAPRALWLFLERLVLHSLGYGICLRRVLVVGLSVILAFIVAYEGAWLAGAGDIQDSCGVSILDVTTDRGVNCDTVATSPRGWWDGVWRLFYFSGVTFTTLGYGDYHPTGWMQVLAVSEALLGAAAIAVVTVLFARKFMRR